MALVVGGLAAITSWSLRLWKRRRLLSPLARAVLLLMAASAAFGLLGTVVGLVKAFGSVGGESIDPSQKARILAEGISEAMNCTAFGLCIGVPSVIALLYMTRGMGKEPD